jgi:hypothetical protein
MLVGDERVTAIIKEVWAQLPPPVRIEAVHRQSEDVFSSHVFLLIDLLECETNERVYGSLVVALGNCAEQAEKSGILDFERVLPIWKALDKPTVVRRHLPRLELISEFNRRWITWSIPNPVILRLCPWSGYAGPGIDGKI